MDNRMKLSRISFFVVFRNMKCPRCQNEDPNFFAYDKGVYYCRKCIVFSRVQVGDTIEPCHLSHRVWKGKPKLTYELTEKQKQCSTKTLNHLKQGRDVFVYAATGAGKTEITFASISYYLSQGKKVAFAISRRQVVLEIAERLRKAFCELSVVEVAQDYTQVTDADLIVCTMHQLYRYPYGFDLLILDEVDAFPYAGNTLLEAIVDLSCIGQKLYLSATPSSEILAKIEAGKMEVVKLFERPHKHPLVIPKVIQRDPWRQVLYLLIFCARCQKEHKQVLVFVPRRQDCFWMAWVLRLVCKAVGIHSTTHDKDKILEAFRQKQYDVLVCTTLLERGITIGSVQVAVYQAQHIVFSTASLIQIFGRIGRTFEDPTGKGVCLCQYASQSVRECIKLLEWMNDSASSAMPP